MAESTISRTLSACQKVSITIIARKATDTLAFSIAFGLDRRLIIRASYTSYFFIGEYIALYAAAM